MQLNRAETVTLHETHVYSTHIGRISAHQIGSIPHFRVFKRHGVVSGTQLSAGIPCPSPTHWTFMGIDFPVAARALTFHEPCPFRRLDRSRVLTGDEPLTLTAIAEQASQLTRLLR